MCEWLCRKSENEIVDDGRTFAGSRFRLRSGATSAFTLIELILVMLVVCMTLAIASPNLRGFFSGRKAADTADHIHALLRKCSLRATAEGKAYRLVIDDDSEEEGEKIYRIERMKNGSFEKIGEAVGKDFSIPQRVEVEIEVPEGTDAESVVFYPDQTCDTGKITVTYGTEKKVLKCEVASEGYRVYYEDD